MFTVLEYYMLRFFTTFRSEFKCKQICNTVHVYVPIYSLKFSNTKFMIYCNVNHKRAGEEAFSHYAPKIWKLFPIEIAKYFLFFFLFF